MADTQGDIRCPMCGRRNAATVITCPDCGERSHVAPIEVDATIFRDGPLLVIASDSELPLTCPLTNEPGQARLTVTQYWHPRWAYVLLLFPCLYFLVLLVVQHTVTFSTGVSSLVLWRQRRDKLIAWGVCLLVCVFACLWLASRQPSPAPEVVACFGILFAVFCMAITASVVRELPSHKLLQVDSVSDRWIRLSGCHPEYLEQFPAWEQQRSHRDRDVP